MRVTIWAVADGSPLVQLRHSSTDPSFWYDWVGIYTQVNTPSSSTMSMSFSCPRIRITRLLPDHYGDGTAAHASSHVPPWGWQQAALCGCGGRSWDRSQQEVPEIYLRFYNLAIA
jgi:hypothetical protein